MSGTSAARTEEQIAKAGAQLGTLPSTFRKPHSSHALLQQGSQRPSGLAVKPILKTTLCYRGGLRLRASQPCRGAARDLPVFSQLKTLVLDIHDVGG